MKVLFIGGTGVISSACSALAVERGLDLYLLNRGESKRAIPSAAKVLKGDIRDPESARSALGDLHFDVIVDWIAFTPDHIEADIELFRDRTDQFIFISSASAYQTPPARLPVTESTILDNPYWQYSRDKIACEERLVRAYREEKFPFTVVRPSHTYDRTMLPLKGRYTVIDRMRKGKKVVVHEFVGTELVRLDAGRGIKRDILAGRPVPEIRATGTICPIAYTIAPIVTIGKTAARITDRRRLDLFHRFDQGSPDAVDVRNGRFLTDPDPVIHNCSEMLDKMTVDIGRDGSDRLA